MCRDCCFWQPVNCGTLNKGWLTLSLQWHSLMFCMKSGFEWGWKWWPAVWEHNLLHCGMKGKKKKMFSFFFLFSFSKSHLLCWTAGEKYHLLYSYTAILRLIHVRDEPNNPSATKLKAEKGSFLKMLCRKLILIQKQLPGHTSVSLKYSQSRL